MNGTRICSVPGCTHGHYARGMCLQHYGAWIHLTPAASRRRPSIGERFNSKIRKGDPSDCWPWTAGTTSNGYGRFDIGHGVRSIASRYALVQAIGEPDDPSMLACHTCDNPPCCNPAHLYWGTQLDNSQDAINRGRKARGERSATAKLTERAVREIRRLAARGWLLKDIAARYGVSSPAISDVVNGRSWTHVPTENN